jgi:hypothetical protein
MLQHVALDDVIPGRFVPAWLHQNLEFQVIDSLSYGLVQHEGGPCGVLAALQAFILKQLIFITQRG